MRILVAGANGFIGKNVVEYFKKNTKWHIDEITDDLREGLTLDLQTEYDVFLNLASIASVDRSIADPEEVITNNVMLMTTLLEAARAFRPKLFIHLSTVEADNITNPYAASKKAQEAICKAYSRTYDIPTTVVKATNIFGPGQSPDKFVPKIIDLIKQGKPVPIYTTNGEIGQRIWMSVKNVADALQHIIETGFSYASGYTEIELPGGRELSNLQMAQLVAKGLQTKLLCEFIDAKSIRPNYLLNYDQKDSIFIDNWFPFQTVEQALEEIL